jgi:hypothetical protein
MPEELASLPIHAPDGRPLQVEPAHRCSYCGCVYVRTEPPTILGYKDEQAVGPVSWVPVRERGR